jgi:hypothetical protein
MPGPLASHSRDPPHSLQATRGLGIIRNPACCRLCRYRHKRHRFAIRTLVDGYRDGRPVDPLLPVLATYLGHVHVHDTYWYLEAVPELLQLATERLVDGDKGGAL